MIVKENILSIFTYQGTKVYTLPQYISSFGKIDCLKISIDDNYIQTEKYIGRAQTERQYIETRAYTDRFLVEREELFLDRIAGSFIREWQKHLGQAARPIGAIQIHSDAVRKHLGKVPLLSKGDDSLYTPEMTAKTYQRVL
jgi:hypothetical protein